MPLGDVRLYEFASAVKQKVEALSDFTGKVLIVDADKDAGLDVLRKSLGTGRWGFRLQYDSPAVLPSPGFNRVIEWEFRLIGTLLYRKMGSSASRPVDSGDKDITKLYKVIVNALQGERLSLLNKGGVECGPADYISDESALQTLRFTVTGRSQESRS